GRDITEMSRCDVREMFGMVLQDTVLFSGSVYENIAYGKEGATRAEVMEAARKAHIDDFIDTLPNGYETEINEDSTNISAGQKQLLTIARAYLSDRPILILDEATSNVDTRTELLIQQTMDELMKGRTAFVIAHRLSTIENADTILVVDNGHIVEQGKHGELLRKNGLYARIYNSQYPNA
ncbi:MAG: ATP-binding cassette domain-containing protein, partial [Clostridia bacterium]|nr:ATP-binding cassette domain-containing protein [Clostridia bacterium]